MKILFIGDDSENTKKTITELTDNECIKASARFSYEQEKDFEKISGELIEGLKKYEGIMSGHIK